MKTQFIILLSSFLPLFAANMAEWKSESGNWEIISEFWSCQFFEGHMFPGNFRFPDGKTAGDMFFRDAIKGSDGKRYSLNEERWTDFRVLENTETDFRVECTGKFWCNQSPIISSFPGVTAICQYTFKKKSPSVVIQMLYLRESRDACFIETSFHIGWYIKCPFTQVEVNGKSDEITLPTQQKVRYWDTRNQLLLAGNGHLLKIEAARVILGLVSDDLYPVYINAGFWQEQWPEGQTKLEVQAVLTLQ